jgi:gamma-glutamyl hydrolase
MLGTQVMLAAASAARWHGRDSLSSRQQRQQQRQQQQQQHAHTRRLNPRPIVGIMTLPTQHLGVELQTRSYIDAGYVKFVEQAGARVVPIHFDATEAELKLAFDRVNGILFTGGATDLFGTPLLRKSAALLFEWAIAANDAGGHFPLWGTCQGFQLLVMLSRYRRGAAFPPRGGVMCRGCFSAMDISLPLDFAEPAASKSRMYGRMQPDLKRRLGRAKLTANFHEDGFKPGKFHRSGALSRFWTVTSTSLEPRRLVGKLWTGGQRFVASVEAKHYPFSAVQVICRSHARCSPTCQAYC